MDAVLELLLAAVSSPWFYLAVGAVAALDGFFPPVPSEATVIAAAAIGASAGAPHPVLLGLAAAAGAAAGDNLTYAVGRAIGTDRFAWMRGSRARGAIGRARRGLARRGALLILIGRYVPLGRLAVNLVAGATGYPRRRFLALTLLAGSSWATYTVTIGSVAGRWIDGHPFLGAAAGVALAIVLGVLTDRGASRWQRRTTRHDRAAPEREHAGIPVARGTCLSVRAPVDELGRR